MHCRASGRHPKLVEENVGVVGHSGLPDTTFALVGHTSKSKVLMSQLLTIKRSSFPGTFMRYSSHDLKEGVRRKMQKKRSAKNALFRPGTTGACEAQLWKFVGSERMLKDNDAPDVHWVAAESLDT